MKLKYLQVMNIDVQVVSFHGTHVAERTGTHQGPFIKEYSKLELIIYSVP